MDIPLLLESSGITGLPVRGPQTPAGEVFAVAAATRKSLRRGVQGTPWQGQLSDAPGERSKAGAITCSAVLPDLVTDETIQVVFICRLRYNKNNGFTGTRGARGAELPQPGRWPQPPGAEPLQGCAAALRPRGQGGEPPCLRSTGGDGRSLRQQVAVQLRPRLLRFPTHAIADRKEDHLWQA